MNKFDFITHKRNSKGQIIGKNPYRVYIKGGETKYERPPGSGNMYAPNGELLSGPLYDEMHGKKEKAKEQKQALEKVVKEMKQEVPKPVEVKQGYSSSKKEAK